MTRPKKEARFQTEAELCAAFQRWVAGIEGWTFYAETHGWDILLAHADGTQIGIQAKLKFNLGVLQQAVEWGGPRSWPDRVGPDYRAILIPEPSGAEDLLDALGITEFWAHRRGPGFTPDIDTRNPWGPVWHYCSPPGRHVLPRYVPDVPAGVPSPCALTQWKVAALEIAATIELRGYVTREDFKRVRIDHRRWVQAWLEPADVPGTPGAWRWRDGIAQPFQAQHPEVYPKVLADIAELLSPAAVPA